FFKLQLVMFFEGVRSERLLMRLVADRLSVLWYLRYNLGEPLPDHSSLTRIRTRYGLAVFRRFFAAIVEQCQQAGLVWGRELYFDATQVLADASLDSLTARFAVQAREALHAHLAALFPDETTHTAHEATHNETSEPAVPFLRLSPPPRPGTLAVRVGLCLPRSCPWTCLHRYRKNWLRPMPRGMTGSPRKGGSSAKCMGCISASPTSASAPPTRMPRRCASKAVVPTSGTKHTTWWMAANDGSSLASWWRPAR